MRKSRVKISLYVWLGLLVVLNVVWIVHALSVNDDLTHIYFLDVGHGDSILITTADHQAILIDGGPSADVVADIDRILPFWATWKLQET